jgi:hypothetical protein
MKALLLALLLLVHVYVHVVQTTNNNKIINSNLIQAIPGAPSGTLYHYIPAALAVSRHDADPACFSLGLRLAAIPTVADLLWVGGVIKEEAWIGSFRGEFGGGCVAAFRGGAVAVPVGECESNRAVLCS